ncbi:MAG: TonB family protein [Acidobacteriota bacterium]
MAAKNRPYEQFGSFILFKRLAADSLGDLWRAGRIDGAQLGKTVAVHRLTGGKREAFVACANEARALAPLLTGTTFAKEQVIDVVNGTPFIAHEYGGGRSLRHIVDRARGTNGAAPNPIPLEQAIVIAEKVALSLATTADLRYMGNRLAHGGLVPQFIWIADDGEIRVGGQQLGKAMIASLAEPKFHAELARYFAPEYQTLGEPTKSSEVYSMGAILYLLVTGNEPPEAVTTSAFANTIHAAKTSIGQPIPEDIRGLIHKSLNIDPAVRFASVADMKQAISALAHGGKYSATTFNLAFYLSNLLKKEMESEALDREKEAKVNVAAYADAASLPVPAAVTEPSMAAYEEAPKRSRIGLIAAAAAIVIAVGTGAAYMLLRKPAPAIVAAAPVSTTVKAQITAPAVIASSPATTSAATTDTAAQKKAFEQAVEQKLQEEMMKLQSDYTKSLKQQQSKNAPVQIAAAAPPPPAAEENGPSAAQLDSRRLAARTDTALAPVVLQPAAPAITQTQAPVPQAPAAAPAVVVREGDVVEYTDLDTVPQPVKSIKPEYPRLAMQQRAKSQVVVSALISETGEVLEVKVLKGDPRFGFNEAAIRGMRAARFSPPVKDGKNVRTWRPQTFVFSP